MKSKAKGREKKKMLTNRTSITLKKTKLNSMVNENGEMRKRRDVKATSQS